MAKLAPGEWVWKVVGAQKETDPVPDSEISRFPNIPEWRALYMLLSRPRSSRLWIVQEFLLNQQVTVQCGQKAFDWPILEKSSRHITV